MRCTFNIPTFLSDTTLYTAPGTSAEAVPWLAPERTSLLSAYALRLQPRLCDMQSESGIDGFGTSTVTNCSHGLDLIPEGFREVLPRRRRRTGIHPTRSVLGSWTPNKQTKLSRRGSRPLQTPPFRRWRGGILPTSSPAPEWGGRKAPLAKFCLFVSFPNTKNRLC